MNNIKIVHPWLALLIIPAIVLVIWFFFRLKDEKRKAKNIASFIIHLMICGLFALSIIDIQLLKATTNTELIILADVSTSTAQVYDDIDRSIKEINSKTDSQTKVGLVCFAKNYELLTPLGEQLKSVKNNRVDKSATNLESALRYTATLYHENVIKKLLLISDGIETDNSAINAIEDLRSEDINVDAVYLKNPVNENEIQINGITFTNTAHLMKNETLKIAIQTGTNVSSTIKLFKENEIVEEQEARLSKGINIIDMPLDTSLAGTFQYRIEIESPLDLDIKNNQKTFIQNIVEKYKVLIIGNRSTDCNSVASLYNDNCDIDSYFNGEDVPYKLEDLIKYDEIVLSNANVVSLNNHEEFITNLEKVVSKFGKSLITYGTTYASGTSSASMSKYNNMLPVQFETSDAKCLALVIDASFSMEEDDRLGKAVEGAIACLDLLGEKDYVTVISFGEETNVLQPLTSVKNREQIIQAIRKIEPSYATNMTRGLQEANEQIRRANFQNKHVILLSDGLPTETNYETSLDYVITNMANNNISTSFINIGCKEGDYLMRHLAQIGNGTYYFINHSSDILDVILNSVADVVTNTKIEGNFEIHLNRENDSLVNDINNLPNINGYNFARIKGSANTVYTVTYVNELGGEREVPLLAYWSLGKGKVMTFTSDISTSWANSLKNSQDGKKLFNNIISYLEPNERIDNIFEIQTTTKGFSTEFNITLDMVYPEAYLEINIYSPSNFKSDPIYLQNEDSITYSFIALTEEIGLYRLELIYHYGNDVYRQDQYYFDFSYSQEYNYYLDGNEQLLYLITGENGKVVNIDETMDYSLLDTETSIRYYESINLYLLIATIVLFIIDIIIRKLSLSDLKFIRK